MNDEKIGRKQTILKQIKTKTKIKNVEYKNIVVGKGKIDWLNLSLY
jgi:hypothetical protein